MQFSFCSKKDVEEEEEDRLQRTNKFTEFNIY